MWLHLTEHSQMQMAQMLLRKSEGIANRLERLLSMTHSVDTDVSAPPLLPRGYPFISTLLLIVIVAVAGNVALAVALMVC